MVDTQEKGERNLSSLKRIFVTRHGRVLFKNKFFLSYLFLVDDRSTIILDIPDIG